jgi:hypothetical protein
VNVAEENRTEADRIRDIIKFTFAKQVAATKVGESRAVVIQTRTMLYEFLRVAGLMPKAGRKAKSETQGG